MSGYTCFSLLALGLCALMLFAASGVPGERPRRIGPRTRLRLFAARVDEARFRYRHLRYPVSNTRWYRLRRAWRDACELSFVQDDGSIGFFPF